MVFNDQGNLKEYEILKPGYVTEGDAGIVLNEKEIIDLYSLLVKRQISVIPKLKPVIPPFVYSKVRVNKRGYTKHLVRMRYR